MEADSLVTEVPEYSGVLSPLGDSPAPTVAKPEFTGGVNGATHLLQKFQSTEVSHPH